MRRPYLPICLSLTLMLATGVALAQTGGKGTSSKPPPGKAAAGSQKSAEDRPPSFANLFPKPTNNNGYEEWVQAADLIQNNPDVEAATQPDATLTFKRRLLAQPPVAQALALLREGLKKPVTSPRTEIELETLFPELPSFQQLARLLRTEEYVEFADGRVDTAIDSLRVGLAFGYRIQTDTLISGLVGLSVDTQVLVEFARHLDQLSVYQCNQVERLVQDFLGAQNPAVHLLALEKSYGLKMLEARRADPNALLTLLDIFDLKKHPEDTEDVQNVQHALITQPQTMNTLLDDAEARISALYDQALLNLSLPLAQRKSLVRDTSNAPGAALCRLMAVDAQRIQDVYAGDQAKLRLLGVHVLIHRYRWEHNALPGSLADLHAAELVKDPFTGDLIVYQRDGERYSLYSQGPFLRDDTGKSSATERVPVKLIP